MPSKGMIQWSANWFGPDLVKAAYHGLASRKPTEAELQTQVAAIKRDGKVSAVIRDISRTPEAWAQALHAQPAELARQLYRGVNGEDPSSESLEAAVRQLEQRPDVPALVANMVADRRRRLGLLELEAGAVVQAAFKASLGRPADATDQQGFATRLLETGNLQSFLVEVENCAEHRALLQPPASEEHTRAVQALYRGLLGREVIPEELDAHLQALAAGQPLDDLVRSLSAQPEHQASVTRSPEHSAELVRAAYMAQLGREPDPDGLQQFTDFLSQGGAFVDFLSAMESSEEHWARLIDTRAEWFVRVAFLALLKREPEPEALAHFAQSLRASLDLRAFIAEVGSCREHRDLLLRAAVARKIQ